MTLYWCSGFSFQDWIRSSRKDSAWRESMGSGSLWAHKRQERLLSLVVNMWMGAPGRGREVLASGTRCRGSPSQKERNGISLQCSQAPGSPPLADRPTRASSQGPGERLSTLHLPLSLGLCIPLYLPGLLQILRFHLSWDLPQV